ncbi:MAG: ribosome biogenesis GTP-binding protein YihA/YsxC [Eubacteriales bacterium]|nr:ribosome biogenesis GTP-binding protein YihA/YsxC [Eubacteriales bacterium]
MSINFNNADLSRVAGISSQHLKEGYPQIAFSGRSNVGKSSLINSLLKRKKLARVSGTPGKTITANYYLIDGKLFLVDLPGYGFARRPKEDRAKWSEMTQAYFEENHALRLIIQLIDCRVGPTPDDADMFEWMNHYEVPYIVVCTKCDKLNKTELTDFSEKINSSPLFRQGTNIILYSAEKGIGRDELIKRIIEAV